MKRQAWPVIGLMLATGTVAAQENPNSAEYHARHNTNSSYYVGGTTQQPAAPQPVWADRWGAIAADGNGVFGIVSDMTSKRKAQKSAIQECKNRGGGACVVDLAYYNQCAAVGANSKNSFSFSAPTQKEAEDLAVGRCEKSTGEKCNVYYSGCSTAVQVN
ncbi:DUF4189 domain-containing protein [Luteimonas aquatica]|uniref:DUF4189 domain-containing protein n=1 Tax=Luteimonas aquatica TaxID=450364 RepID=UPI001F580BD8|nr:DUF4189 domain-containing protein [Luteimonas aquatica]